MVTFSTVGGLGAFNVNTALTDANGQAQVSLTPATASANGADLVLAQVSQGSTTVTGTIGFQVTPSNTPITTGRPSIALTLSSPNVTSTTPATLRPSSRTPMASRCPVKSSSSRPQVPAIGAFASLPR